MSEWQQEVAALRSRIRVQNALLAVSVLISLVAFFRTTPRPSRPKRPADEIVTHGLIVIDDKGKMRASIGTAQDGASITLFDQQQRPRIGMDLLNRDGPELSLNDVNGNISAELRHDAEGPRLELTGANGKKTVVKP